MTKINKKELVELLIENFVTPLGQLDLTGLDFTSFEGDVNINGLKVKGNLHQSYQVVGGKLEQKCQNVKGDLRQDHQSVNGNLHQGCQNVKGNLWQYHSKVNGNLHQEHQNVYGYLIQSDQNVKGDFGNGNSKYGGEIYEGNNVKLQTKLSKKEYLEKYQDELYKKYLESGEL